ncbi:TPM domain-containing protein [Sphaerotilus sp.]|uniref:TPM domain-containing protein n=1 Tax=Sphaerotilus sp. TaxID=2093942 RepID=UPI002ACE8CB8|nr:TPM domain-containing protein [Sphaerotilus sp.]MDZ7857435.1 TPM domain-containing protein [Sphaerotilus sp.]
MAKDKTSTPGPIRFQRSWQQWWHHLWSDRSDIAHVLGDEALTRLEARITASEQGHSGEIRLCVEAALPWRYLREGASPRTRALSVFSKLRVWDTEHNNGVLVYLLLADRAIEIVADRALHRHIDPAQWQALVEAMQPLLREGRHEAALLHTIGALDEALRHWFPLSASQRNPNELPNRADLR